MGCNMCVVQKPEEQYKVMLQVNGKELSKLSQEQTLEALRSSKEPLVIQVLRRSPRLRGDSSCHDLQLVDSGTQTDITFEHIMALGKLRPPTPPMVILEPYVLSELPPISHEYYDPAEFMEGGPQEADRMDELEYEEVELYKTSHRDKLGLMVCYRTDDEEDLGIYVGEVNPNSIAAKDGRIREGDRIIQINGVDVQNREEAVAILSQEENTNISLLVARPESQLAKRWKDSDRDDFLDDFGSEHEGELRARKLKPPAAQQLGNEEEKGVPDVGTGLSNSQELDSGVGRTDESTRTEESSEHDLLGDEPASAADTPGALRKSRDLHFSMDSLLAEGAALGGGDLPGLTEEEYERYRELLEIKGHLENGNQLGLLFPRASGGGNSALDVNRNESLGHEMAMLEEELRHLEFKCRNILRAQKMQQLRERCMKAWLLEEEGLYDLGAGEPKKHELSDISELPEKSDKDSTSAYNTGESCRSTPLLAEPLPESPLRRAAAGNSNLNRTPPGPAGPTHPKAAPPQGSPAKFRSLSRDPELGRRPHSEERVRRSPKPGVTLERVGPEGSPYLSRRHRGQGQESEHYHSCVQLAPAARPGRAGPRAPHSGRRPPGGRGSGGHRSPPHGVEGQGAQRWDPLCGQAAGARSPPQSPGPEDPGGAQRHDHRRRCGERDEDGPLLEQGGAEAAPDPGPGAAEAARVHDAEPAGVPAGAAERRQQGRAQHHCLEPPQNHEEAEQEDPGQLDHHPGDAGPRHSLRRRQAGLQPSALRHHCLSPAVLRGRPSAPPPPRSREPPKTLSPALP
uniref:PDZ domain-containing protein n=1 Tax=Felis catus TaxID=9685 RepID=A0ABI7VSK2_FELCA